VDQALKAMHGHIQGRDIEMALPLSASSFFFATG
jgi:hypothetical protein